MIVENAEQLTDVVLEAYAHFDNPRWQQIMAGVVRHLHDLTRELRLTEAEWQAALQMVVRLGQKTTPSHNEAVLMAGSLGMSQLICLLNNGGDDGNSGGSANMLGPFWRADAPFMANGATLLRSATPGTPLFFTGHVRDAQGQPVEDAEIHVWHSATTGLYENQDVTQAEMNLRGRFRTNADGMFQFRSIKPAGYPIPIDGPVGDLLRAAGRHNFRPAHVHALIYKPGYKTITSQVYSPDDPYLHSDAQFGVTRALIGDYQLHENDPAPWPDVTGPWYSLDYVFTIEPGQALLPKPPITAKTQ